MALVLTPESGEENRARIAEKAREAKVRPPTKPQKLQTRLRIRLTKRKIGLKGLPKG